MTAHLAIKLFITPLPKKKNKKYSGYSYRGTHFLKGIVGPACATA